MSPSTGSSIEEHGQYHTSSPTSADTPAPIDATHGDDEGVPGDTIDHVNGVLTHSVKPETLTSEVEAHATSAAATAGDVVGENERAVQVESSLQLENVENGARIPSHPTLDLSGLEPHPADKLHAPDSPTTSLISSLRSQLLSLSEQIQMLNTKLVSAVSQRGDLEDQLFALQTDHAAQSAKVLELEKSKAQWEEHVRKGLLVERDQIAAEMQRLAAGLVEEERRRGSAEEKRAQVEGEIDELAATLFDQANTMVATERISRVQAEERLRETEENLAAAESAMRDMQAHLQSLTSLPNDNNSASHSLSPSDPSTVTALASSGSSGSANAGVGSSISSSIKHLSSHVPYAEFITFVQHLRALRPIREKSKETFPPPLISALMAQPFLSRAATEDHEPTLRLDTAPDLSWLSRRSVGAAIIAGDLIIEPVPAHSVIAGTSGPIESIGCSMCGRAVFPPSSVSLSPASGAGFGAPPSHPLLASRSANSSTTRFSLKPFFATSPGAAASPGSSPIASSAPLSASTSTPGSVSAPPNGISTTSATPTPAASTGGSLSSNYPPVYIFRVAPAAQGDKDTKSYPLCKSGWCLERLRATCAMWHFLRTGIIHVVWHGDDVPSTYAKSAIASGSNSTDTTSAIVNVTSSTDDDSRRNSAEPGSSDTLHRAQLEAPPPLPTRRKSGWGLGFKLGERSASASSWTKAFNRSSVGTGAGGSGTVSAGATPPQSPGLGHGNSGKLELASTAVIESEPGDKKKEKAGLGAPLELKGDTLSAPSAEEENSFNVDVKKVDSVPVPKIQQTDASPESATSDGVAGAGGLGSSPPISSEIDSDAENAAFSTPKGEPTELDEEGGEVQEQDAENEVSAEEKETADQTSDALDRILNMAGEDEDATKSPVKNDDKDKKEEVEETKEEERKKEGETENDEVESTPTKSKHMAPPSESSDADTSARPIASFSSDTLSNMESLARFGTATPPPPLPKRAAARNRLSQLSVTDGNGSGPSSPAGHLPVPSPLSVSVSEPDSASAKNSGQTGVDDSAINDITTDQTQPVLKSPSPPLPSRHPKQPSTPAGQIASLADDTGTENSNAAVANSATTPTATAGGKTYLPEEGWEAKTWRAVIKLKEDMWRARVGLVIED